MLDTEWLAERHKLFERFCLPSVLSQTNKNFEWVLVADSRTSDSFREVLDAYPVTVLYASFDYDFSALRTKHIRAIKLEEAIAKPLKDYLETKEANYIITSRLDSDDAISTDHIDKVQRYSKEYKKRGMPFWLNLVRGYKWCGGNVYPIGALSNPFISFIEPQGNLLTAYQCCHKVALKQGFRVDQVREGNPTWMQVIHGGNLLNKLMRYKGEMPFSNVEYIFKVRKDHEEASN